MVKTDFDKVNHLFLAYPDGFNNKYDELTPRPPFRRTIVDGVITKDSYYATMQIKQVAAFFINGFWERRRHRLCYGSVHK